MSHNLLDGHVPEDKLAEELGVTPRTLRRWHAARTGPRRTRIGRRIFYSRMDVTEWLARQREDTPERRRAA